jgi:hypothetical protein
MQCDYISLTALPVTNGYQVACMKQLANGITFIIMDIIHRPAFHLKYFSETGFCLRLQVEYTQVGPIDRISPCLRCRDTIITNLQILISLRSC